MYDPSGDTKLDGKDILGLLAAELGLSRQELTSVLLALIQAHKWGKHETL